jgi:flagella basal body P-ring formation protein FlgA
MVKLIKKSIAIELMGRSLQSGTTGDEITVTLQNGKVVTGTIHNDAIECKL